tara:strand:- start:1212 stop:1481 length:270 start_codon:yes stop_codon:yes gene_type:complete
LAKGRALARPSERSERFEPVVRPGLADTVAAATQKEKADAAKSEGERGKLFVTLPGINQLLLIMPITRVLIGDAVLRVKPTGEELPEAA